MKHLRSAALLLIAAGALFAQTPNPAQRRQIQEAIRSLKQRLAAHYSGDLPPDQIQQRIDQLQQQLDQLGPAPPFTGRPISPRPSSIAPPPCVPVNPNATPEARALLQEICDVSGKAILTGQHNYPNERNLDTEAIHTLTGKYPAIWGSDFGFTSGEDQDAITHRDLMIQEARRQYAAGSIIYLCWHMMRPTDDEPGQPGASWSGSVQAKLTDNQWLELVTSDSPLHQRWEKYMDTAAEYLEQLQDAHIPVLFRPMHENNGSFFWWGGRPGPYGTAELYREVYNRMVNVHHLNNLIWVWNQNGPAAGGQFYDFFPGPQFCDIVSYDNYRTLDDRFYQEILTIANGKPIALGEVGTPPPPELLAAQPKWAFYMTWAGMSGATPPFPRAAPAGDSPEPEPHLVPIPDNATPDQLRAIIQELEQQTPGPYHPPFYPIPAAATPDMLRRIAQRLEPSPGNALKAIYDDPYYLKRGDPIPK